MIKKILKWLVLSEETNYYACSLTLPSLAQAISIQQQTALDLETVPDELDIAEWCSSLVRLNPTTKMLELSHFTVKEFLLEDAANIPSTIARSYLVKPTEDRLYLAETCLHYLSLHDFDQARVIIGQKSLQEFTSHYAFYGHAASQFPEYLYYSRLEPIDSVACRRFFSNNASRSISTWNAFIGCIKGSGPEDEELKNSSWYLKGLQDSWTAIQLSSALLLPTITRRLLLEGGQPNQPNEHPASPLHLCISGPSLPSDIIYRDLWPISGPKIPEDVVLAQNSRRHAITETLLSAGADVNTLSVEKYRISKYVCERLSPLCVAIFYLHADVCSLLLAAGARFSSTPDVFGKDFTILEDILDYCLGTERSQPRANEILDILQSLPGVRDYIVRLLADQNHVELEDDESVTFLGDINRDTANTVLQSGCYIGNLSAVKWALRKGADVEAVSNDGESTLLIAVECGNPVVTAELLHCGANIHTYCQSGDSPFTLAYRKGDIALVQSLFGTSVDIELSIQRKMEIFRSACSCQNKDLLDFIIQQGVDVPFGRRKHSVQFRRPCCRYDDTLKSSSIWPAIRYRKKEIVQKSC
jgi:hypothetical protein